MAATASSYEKLLSPGRIGPVTTRNRILKTGAGMLMWHESDTHMRPEMLAFYERMARGGTGLIIVESPTIDYPAGARWRMRYRIDDDRFIEGLKELVDVIHKHGCPTFMQMNHDGPWQPTSGTSNPIRSSPDHPSAPHRYRCRTRPISTTRCPGS